MRPRNWIASVLAMGLAVGATAGVDVAVSVTEPAGIARTDQPVTGGIPFSAGDVKSADDLVLVDAAGQPVPAQFTVLVKHGDGSVKWVLVDFVASIDAGKTAHYTLKTGGGAPKPATPLTINEADDAVTFNTGVVTFTVNKKTFGLFEDVAVNGHPVVTGSAVDLLNCELEKTEVGEGRRKTTFFAPKKGGQALECSTAAPRRVKWEYKGPVRATLRIDGDYTCKLDESVLAPTVSYTTRITAWAGCGAVKVQHSIRNSDPKVGYDAYIRRATLTLDLAIDAADQGRGLDWAAGGDGAVGVLVQDKHTAGIYRGPCTYTTKLAGDGWSGKPYTPVFGQQVAGRQAVAEIVSKGPALTGRRSERGLLGFTQDGIFALADRSHKDSDVWFDFYTGKRDAAANKARAESFRSKLLLFAEGKHYSDTEALAMGHFGTLADEIATYKKWGWTGAENQKKYPKKPHQPLAFVHCEMIHEVTEDDCVEGNLIQFLRTNERGFFDYAEAWAGFYRGHAIYRTDWGEDWGVPAPTGKRAANGLGFGWYGPHWYSWADTRMHGCHHYGRGIFEYYLITGEVDALEAGLDLARQMSAGWERKKPGQGMSLGRSFGRQFLTVLSAWHTTRDPHWKKIADHWAAAVTKAPNWRDDLKLYHQSLGIKNSYFARAWTAGHFPKPPKWKLRPIPRKLDAFLTKNNITASYNRGRIFASDRKDTWEVTYLTQLFELSACHLAFERYARFFDNEAMKKRLVDISEGVNRHYWSDEVDYMIGSPWFGWPRKDQTLDPYEWMADSSKAKISGYATRYTADMFARAYSFTKDPKWLALAKRSWDRGSKRRYMQVKPMAGPDEVGMFAYITGAHSNAMSECSARMFYEVIHGQE